MRVRKSEEGKNTIANILWLGALAAVIYAALNAGPAYIAHYTLTDKMDEVCRLPKALHKDERILETLMKAVREEGLADYIRTQNFTIQTGDGSRRILLEYEREVKFLPGFVKTVQFSSKADQPIAF
jgi:hypothetical protein